MVNKYWVFFIPGAGGNFFARCLNFAEDSICFGNNKFEYPATADQKWALLNYENVNDKLFGQRDWKQFEGTVKHFRLADHIEQLPTNQIWFSHPDLSMLNPDDISYDTRTIIYIDAEDMTEWALLNALYKNSYITVDWLLAANQVAAMPNIKRFKLADMISTSFAEKFFEFTKSIGLVYSDSGKNYVQRLHTQWVNTHCPDIYNWKRKLNL